MEVGNQTLDEGVNKQIIYRGADNGTTQQSDYRL
jgi:hypothetical protein